MGKLVVILFTCFGLILTYNNCSDVGFSKSTTADSTSSSIVPAGDNGGLNGISDDDLLKRLPPEEQGIYRPISDLDKDPSLADIYVCPTGSGIILCHFPSSIGSEHTICVGSVNAALTHSGHELSITPDGKVQGDYLGPCKNVPVAP